MNIRTHFLAALAAFSFSQISLAAPLYTLLDLGDLDGGLDSSSANGINDLGQVVGRSGVYQQGLAQASHGFLWDPLTGMQDLGSFGGVTEESTANDINNLGQVVGSASYANGPTHAYVWESGSGLTDLGILPGGDDFSTAQRINDDGMIVGHAQVTAPLAFSHPRAVMWDAANTIQELGGFSTGSSVANDINAHGQVAGSADLNPNTSITHAYRWEDATGFEDLGFFPGPGDGLSVGNGINDLGQVVGGSALNGSTASVPGHAFLWDETLGMIDLGDLAGGQDFSNAYAINNHGMVVGQSQTQGEVVVNVSHAFLWTESTGMLDLNELIDPTDPLFGLLELTWASDINSSGQIVGTARLSDDRIHAFLATPVATSVPEPSTVLLALPGVVLLWAARRRGKRDTG